MYVLIFKNLYTILKNMYIWFEEYGIGRPWTMANGHKRQQTAMDGHEWRQTAMNNDGQPRTTNGHNDGWP